MAPLSDEIELVYQLLKGTEGYEIDQLSWRLNDGLYGRGIDPVPVYLELIRRGKTWFLTPLRHLDYEIISRALPGLLDVSPVAIERDLRDLIWCLGDAAVFALVAALSRHPSEWVRELAADALGELGLAATSAVSSLIEVVRAPQTDAYLTGRAANALARIGVATPEVLSALTAAQAREEPLPGYTPVANPPQCRDSRGER